MANPYAVEFASGNVVRFAGDVTFTDAANQPGKVTWGTGVFVLAAPANVGATQLSVTGGPLPNGAAITLGSERLTVSKTTGTASPYTTTLTGALTASHPTGAAIVVTDPFPYFAGAILHDYDVGTSFVDDGFEAILYTLNRIVSTNGLWTAGSNGVVSLSAGVSAPAWLLTGRLGEEATFGVAGVAQNYFTDALAGDVVVRAFMSRVLIGTGNGANPKASAMQVDQSRSVGFSVVPEFKAAKPASATDPSGYGAAPTGYVYAIVGGNYVAIPYIAMGGTTAAPAYTAISGPHGATVANGSNGGSISLELPPFIIPTQ